MTEVVNLIDESMELAGNIEFSIEQEDLFNSELKELTIFYKIIGASRIKLFRNNRMELVFVRLNDDWMRQAKVNITGLTGPLSLRLSWDNANVDELAIKEPGKQEYTTARSIQIDN